MSHFLKHFGGFDPKTLAILHVSFEATFKELQHNPYFDPVSASTRIADLIMKIASRGLIRCPLRVCERDRRNGSSMSLTGGRFSAQPLSHRARALVPSD
jgi:hypothetical protein